MAQLTVTLYGDRMVPCEALGGAGKDKVNDMSLRYLL